MNLHEYQSKEILSLHGVAVPQGGVAETPEQARQWWEKLGCDVVLKAQIHAGGRGKAGGIRIATTPQKVEDAARDLLGSRIATPQTGAGGLPVHRLLVEEKVAIERQFYLSLTLDRDAGCYCLVASATGGIDIEKTAAKTPERIWRQRIDPCLGLRPFQARQAALFLGLRGQFCEEAVILMGNLYHLFLEQDCFQLEINPLVLTRGGRLLVLDAKINLDDNALFRHPRRQALFDESQLDPLEVQARRCDIAYIKMSGTIGCLVNGAGLAMATLDMLQECGGQPANFLDVGGGASREKIAEAFRILLQDQDVKGVFVNIFGGIMHCDLVAQGIVDAVGVDCPWPIVVRMAGARVAEGKALLAASGLKVICSDGLEEGVSRMVTLLSLPVSE